MSGDMSQKLWGVFCLLMLLTLLVIRSLSVRLENDMQAVLAATKQAPTIETGKMSMSQFEQACKEIASANRADVLRSTE